MANNRLFLTCEHCNSSFMLAIHLGGEWMTRSHTKESYQDRLDTFLEEHSLCESPKHDYGTYASRLVLTREHDFPPASQQVQ